MPATCVRLAYTVSCVVSCVVWRGKRAGEGGGGRASVEGQRPQASAVRHACHKPRDQGDRGRQNEEGLGGVPRVLLRDVYAGGVKRGRGQGDRGRVTQGPGKGSKGGRGRTNTQGAGLGQGAGAEGGSREGGCNGTQHVRADRDHLVNARACICKAQCNAIQLLKY